MRARRGALDRDARAVMAARHDHRHAAGRAHHNHGTFAPRQESLDRLCHFAVALVQQLLAQSLHIPIQTLVLALHLLPLRCKRLCW